jgi:hypothetical protein
MWICHSKCDGQSIFGNFIFFFRIYRRVALLSVMIITISIISYNIIIIIITINTNTTINTYTTINTNYFYETKLLSLVKFWWNKNKLIQQI